MINRRLIEDKLLNRPWFGASSSFLDKAKDVLDAFRVGEELGERARPAVGSKVPAARIVVEGAFEQYVLDGLKKGAAWAGDLFLCVSVSVSVCGGGGGGGRTVG